MEISDRIIALNQCYQKALSTGKVHNKKEFAELVGISRTSMSSAFNGDERYLTDSLVSKVSSCIEKLELETMFPSIQSIQQKYESQATIPVIPTGARAGTLGDFAEGVKEYDCERMISPIKGADFAIQVTGDSMSPEYPNGSQIIIKKISAEFIAWGNVFCLDTNDGAIIKQVFPTDDESVIECRSLNPAYPPFMIKRDLINGWYRVLMCLSLK